MSQIYSTAFKSTIDEVKKVIPQISNSFIFEKNLDIFTKDDETSEESIKKLVESFNKVTEKADCLDGLETFTIQGTNGQVNISCTNNFYFTTISSYEADEKTLNTLTTVLVPTIIKLVDQITQSHGLQDNNKQFTNDNNYENTVFPEDKDESPQPTTQQLHQPITQSFTTPVDPEPLLPEPPINQFMVEKISGLMVSSDTVRIDKETITGWSDIYNDKQIPTVIIEALNGKKANCKFKPIKDSKYFGKGIIQIPEKIMDALELTKGELIMVKPVIE